MRVVLLLTYTVVRALGRPANQMEHGKWENVVVNSPKIACSKIAVSFNVTLKISF